MWHPSRSRDSIFNVDISRFIVDYSFCYKIKLKRESIHYWLGLLMLTITGIEWNARDSRLFERYPSPLDSVRERSKVSIVGFPSFRGPASILLSGGGDLFLCWSFLAAGVEAVFLRVLHLGHDLPRLAAGIVMVGVSRRLQL